MPLKTKKDVKEFGAADIAREYLRRGWHPVPVEIRQKKPRDKAWQSLAITKANVEEYFERNDNVGLQLGARSTGLTDVDIDCPEALALADVILPATGAIFGRQSKPASHRLYLTDLGITEKKAAFQYPEPPALSDDGKPVMLVELRIGGGGKGAQTLAPGSWHPSGEEVRWDNEGDPTSVSGSVSHGTRRCSAFGSALSARRMPSRSGARVGRGARAPAGRLG